MYNISNILNIAVFLIGLIVVFFIFGIVKRTENKLRKSFIYLFIAGIFFVIYITLNLLEEIDIFKTNLINYFVIFLFAVFFLIGMINLEYFIYRICKKGQVLYIIPKKNYLNELTKLVKSIKGKICYVSIANSSVKLMNTFKKNKINNNYLFFLDIKSSDKEINNIKDSKDRNKIKIVPLKDLRSLIGIYLKENNFDYIIIDNINSIKEKDSKIFRLIKGILLNVKRTNTQGIYICIKEETKSSLIKDLKKYVDKVIRK
ncbi:MAG: hypothetical protein KKD48_03025 [Nanoarchaeota archaeon]|nr:hypothetical protein [Nanoarchaeota archaeon]